MTGAATTPPGRLTGRRAFVTGGASGIGAAIAARLAAEGADVTIGDIDLDAAKAHAEAVGGRAVRLDVTDPASARAAIGGGDGGDDGPFDVLVNNAGVDQPGVFFGDVTPDQWRRLLAVNLEGVFACTQAALPAMQRAGYGRIVNLSSEAGRIGGKANAVYSAAKGAVIAFTKALARENARYGITVNAVAPGPIETPLLRRMDPRAIEMVTASTLLRRLGEPDEVAAAVAFLASAEASYVTGETLGVSGGMGLGG
ncbi:MAG TPA: SDR family NAD(P)-dependent oxidoreductase [Acidimicrobiia bacterium]|nr:SDR family NAD(P)-dependent oxidoreductase [Acidimicrobiia bacterium]